jgi:hypothetical protein
LEISWGKIDDLCQKLSEKISKNYSPDIIIGIIRGGLVPARLISDLMHNKNIATMRVESYFGIGKRKEPKITQKLTVEIKNKSILLVDDVSDSGYSMKEAVKYLKKLHPSTIKTATLHYKPQSIFKPDYYIEETDKWIIYPWEINETKKRLEDKYV